MQFIFWLKNVWTLGRMILSRSLNTPFHDIKPNQNHFQESLNQEPRRLPRPSLKMSTLQVQTPKENDLIIPPVIVIDKTDNHQLEPTCPMRSIYVPFGIAYALWPACSLFNITQSFPVFFPVWFNKGR